jgi:hypothetical protein
MAPRQRTTPTITKSGLKLLRLVLGLATESNLPDPEDEVFIAIDCENTNNIKEDLSLNLDCQAVIAILDPRSLRNSQQAISTHNFATG